MDGAEAATFAVAPDGSGDVPDIQSAVFLASPGDTVELEDGIFAGSGNRDISYLGKAITVRSRSNRPDLCIVACGGTPADWHRGFLFVMNEGPGSILEGVQVEGAYWGLDGGGGAVFCEGGRPVLRNCWLLDNEADVGAGVFCYARGSVTLVDCILSGNVARIGSGAYVQEGAVEFVRTVVTGNQTASGAGAVFIWLSEFSATQCTIAGNNGRGIVVNTSSGTIERTVLWGNCGAGAGQDLRVAGSSEFPPIVVWLNCSVVNSYAAVGDYAQLIVGHDNVFTNPFFCDPIVCGGAPTMSGDYRVGSNSPCLPENNDCAQLIGVLGQGCGVVGVDVLVPAPERATLSPNPFHSWVEVVVPSRRGQLRAQVFDVAGRVVRTLESGVSLRWDGRDAAGRPCAAGLYFLRLTSPSHAETHRVAFDP